MTVHRFIPAGEKHGDKTACGILLYGALSGVAHAEAATSRGSVICISGKGEPFDCSRCRRVLEIFHGKQ